MYSAVICKLISANAKFARQFCTPAQAPAPAKTFKVAVCGAAGGIGQPLSLLLKFNALISDLSLYDVHNVQGVATDLSHIETATKVNGYTGPENLDSALENSDLILIAAGVPRSPGMTRSDLFSVNAKIVHSLMQSVAKVASGALVGIITNPVNSMVPVACEVLKKANKFDPRKVFGISTLDIVRANTFAAEVQNIDPKDVYVPVIGGHSSPTMVPLLSKTTPALTFTEEQIKELTLRIQEAGTEVVNAKDGGGSATLSMAYAAGRFASSALRALNGAENIIEIAYIYSDVAGTQYFGHPFILGKEGIEKHLRMANLSEYESALLDSALEQIKADIDTGLNFTKHAKTGQELNV